MTTTIIVVTAVAALAAAITAQQAKQAQPKRVPVRIRKQRHDR